jgi:hypothetical protein
MVCEAERRAEPCRYDGWVVEVRPQLAPSLAHRTHTRVGCRDLYVCICFIIEYLSCALVQQHRQSHDFPPLAYGGGAGL